MKKSKITLYSSNVRGDLYNVLYPNAMTVHNTDELCEVVAHDHVCSEYTNNHRLNENFIQADCNMFDLDNTESDNPHEWKTPEDVKQAFPNVPFYVSYSRNHMKTKNGKAPRPKFHVYFPIMVISSNEEYTQLKERVVTFFPAFDSNAKDAARFFFGVENPQVEYYDGEILLSKFMETVQVDKGREQVESHPVNQTGIIPQGERNTAMYRYACRVLARLKDTDRAYEDFILESAKCTPPLDEKELFSIWDSALKFYNREKKERQGTQSEIILELLEEIGATVFRNETNDPYVSMPVDGHMEVWPIDGSDFDSFLYGLHYNETKKPAKKEAVKQVLDVLSSKAKFGGTDAVPLFTRVAKNNGVLWYDLSNPTRQAVEITADGWKVVDNPPILFNRYRHQTAQANPQQGGDIRKLLQYINLKENHILFLCWLVSSFIPEIPHAMPIFYGEKGAAKSTACSLLKRLIDPSVLDTLTLQNNPRSLAVNLQQHWFLPFDNVSKINEETSDTLCRAITGGGIQQRKLYSNAEDYIFRFLRCLAVNGINNVANRSDLLDRSILIELERIAEADRRELSVIQAAFAEDLPSILGGIFDTLVRAMAVFPTVSLEKLPRMADFARWGYAVGEALGGYGQKFLEEYAANRKIQNTEALNSDVVAVLLIAFMSGLRSWEGRVSALLAQLVEIAPRQGINPHSKEFPSQPNGLSRRMNSIKSNLEEIGISFIKHCDMYGTVITINNDKVSSLPPYHHTPGKLYPSTHVGTMEVNTGNGNNQELPPYANTLCDKGYGDNGGNGDESVTF